MRLTLLANGHREPIDLADAYDLCQMYEALNRAIPREVWVDSIREEVATLRNGAALDGLI